MYKGKKVIVVMPAYNSESTLKRTYDEVMDQGIVDSVIVVDDGSRDHTRAIAAKLKNVKVVSHPVNRGYGATQKTCYETALKDGGDIIIMVHSDYQYTPKLIPAMASLIGNGLYHCVIGSRILGGYALKGRMPVWKYVLNRGLTFVENVLMNAKLSEYHSGYRAFSRELLEVIPYQGNSDDFVFDNEMLAQIIWWGYTVAEISCPTNYFPEASSMNVGRSLRYGIGSFSTAVAFKLARMGLVRSNLFPPTK